MRTMVFEKLLASCSLAARDPIPFRMTSHYVSVLRFVTHNCDHNLKICSFSAAIETQKSTFLLELRKDDANYIYCCTSFYLST